MRQNRLKRIYVFLKTRAASHGGELEAREGAAVGTEIPSRDEVASRRLVVDLGGRRQRDVELRW